MTPYGVLDLGQHWTNVDLSLVKPCDIYIRRIAQSSSTKISLKFTNVKFHWNFPEANELTHCGLGMPFDNTDLGQQWLS